MKHYKIGTLSGCILLLVVSLGGCGNSQDKPGNQSGESPQQIAPPNAQQ